MFRPGPANGGAPGRSRGDGGCHSRCGLADDAQSALLLDVTPHNLGIMVHGGLLSVVIPRNMTVPISRSHIFTTVKDNQTSVKILVMQGESEEAVKNELLGEFILTNLRAASGEVEIEVAFDINADGIVAVSAKDLETGIEQAITVTATSGLTEDEIESMIQENEDHLVARRSNEELESRRVEAQRVLMEVERIFPKVKGLLDSSEFGQEALRKADGVVDRAKSALEGEDVNELRSTVDALKRTHDMFKGVIQKIG